MDTVILVAFLMCISLSTVANQPVNPKNDAPGNLAPLVMTLMEEVKSLRKEVRDGLGVIRKKLGPKKKKREELVKKVDMCSEGVEQLRMHLIPTTTPVPSTTLPTTMTICEAGWVKHNEHCYFFSTELMSWGQAKIWCMESKTQLVSVNSQAEQDFLVQNIPEGYEGHYWTGLTWVPEELQWPDGSDVNFTAWGQHNPNCMEGQGCRAALSVSKKWLWEDFGRSSRERYICEGNNTLTVPYVPPTTPEPKTSYCPPGAVPFQGHCYLFELAKRTLEGASQMCKGQGFYLVSINTQEEQDFLLTNIRKYYKKDEYWIGMSYNKQKEKLEWQDGSDVTYTSWARNQPNCMAGTYICGAFLSVYYSLNWEDADRNAEQYFICEVTGTESA